MAQITFTIADPDVPRVVAAFEYDFGERQPEETIDAFVRRHIIDMINRWVKRVTANQASNDAMVNYVDLDIT